MKISIWNIYNQLPYPEKIPLIKNGAPTIENARWIIPRDLNPNSVYIGSAGEFFDSAENDTLIVHRYDMILIHNTEPEEAFNEVSSIMERFQKWESELKNCCNSKNGLREMLRNSAWILQNPAFIYAPDGRALAISPDYPASIHWHWAEILKNNGLTEERMEKLQESIDLTNVFLDREPTTRNSHMGSYQYMHCSLVVNNYMAGHLVIFSMLKPFEKGLPWLVSIMVQYMQQYMYQHTDIFSPTSRIGELISALIDGRPCSEKSLQLFQKILGWKIDSDLFRFYLLKENVTGEPVLTAGSYLRLSGCLRNAAIFREDRFLVILCNIQNSFASEQSIETELQTIGKKFHCGISMPFRGMHNLRPYFRQAHMELARCEENGVFRSYAKDHIGSYIHTLFDQDKLSGTYLRPEISRLHCYDEENHTHYYETLRAWFYSGFHPGTAAAFLQIHRNSFLYRMDRIREIIPLHEIDLLSSSHDLRKINEFFYTFLYYDS